MSVKVTCDLCESEQPTKRYYLRSWTYVNGRRHQTGHGTLDICDVCAEAKFRTSKSGRPRTVPRVAA